MSLLGFDALGRWALGQLPSNGNVALLASGQSFTVAGQVAVFRTSSLSAPGTLNSPGNPAGFRVLEPGSVGGFALAGGGAAFISLLPGLRASVALTGSAANETISAVGSPGAVVTSAGASSLFLVSLAPMQGAFVSAGGSSTYDRDHEAWVRRPFDTMSWQTEATLLPLTWSDAAPRVSAWMTERAPANAWTPAPIEPEPWTTEQCRFCADG